LNDEALRVLEDVNITARPKAFWEIFAKRTNESIHLLSGSQIHNILRAFDNLDEQRPLLAGICRVVCEDIANRGNLSERFDNISLAIKSLRIIERNSFTVPITVVERFIAYFADRTYQLESQEPTKDLIQCLAHIAKGHESEVQKLLYKKLFLKWHHLCGGLPSGELPIDINIEDLVSLVGVSHT